MTMGERWGAQRAGEGAAKTGNRRRDVTRSDGMALLMHGKRTTKSAAPSPAASRPPLPHSRGGEEKALSLAYIRGRPGSAPFPRPHASGGEVVAKRPVRGPRIRRAFAAHEKRHTVGTGDISSPVSCFRRPLAGSLRSPTSPPFHGGEEPRPPHRAFPLWNDNSNCFKPVTPRRRFFVFADITPPCGEPPLRPYSDDLPEPRMNLSGWRLRAWGNVSRRCAGQAELPTAYGW